MPHYKPGSYSGLVPKDFQDNLRCRRRLIEQGSGNPQYAEALWIACSRDPLFYLNAFVWTFDPRGDGKTIPFIAYPFQEEAIKQLISSILRNEDAVIEKSRDMGATWINLFVMEWFWHFRPSYSFLVGSRKEEFVDKKGDPKTLFWKIDFIHKWLPGWLMPRTFRVFKHIENLDNGSVIDGESTNADFARGDRRSAILLDEFASVTNGYEILAATADATGCRIFNSTPKGTGNAFYDRRQKCKNRLTFHWSQHPKRNKGLYKDKEGKLRSPWYDKEVQRRSNPAEIAQELDIDYQASGYQFFDPKSINKLETKYCQPPVWVGEIEYVPDSFEFDSFEETPDGSLRLWLQPDAVKQDREYVIGCDIAVGTGASNSCLSIADANTREKVGEYVTPVMKPYKLAGVAVALCRVFRGRSGDGAYLIWEANGPGRDFGDTVLESGYTNVFLREKENSLRRSVSMVAGWWSSKDEKKALLSTYRRFLTSENYVNRSHESMQETLEYVYVPDGGVEHAGSVNAVDPTGARENHGDRVIADALAVRGLQNRRRRVDPGEKIPHGCLAWRIELQKKKERMAAEHNWLDFT